MFLDREINELSDYVLHLTQHTSHGALTFIDSILQDKNPCVTDATLIVTDAT